MQPLALVLSILAVLLGLLLWFRAGAQALRIDDLEGEVRRNANAANEQLRRELETMKKLLTQVAAGETLSEEMIEEGRLWKEVRVTEGRELVSDSEVLIVDVRRPAECAGGIIPGALQIPIEEMEERYLEIPNDQRGKLIYCAMGIRSAAVCDFLTQKGYERLHNLEGGLSAWDGVLERA